MNRALIEETLNNNITAALMHFSLKRVIEFLKQKKHEFECLTLISTKGGFGGAPDHDKLCFVIEVLDRKIRELESP